MRSFPLSQVKKHHFQTRLMSFAKIEYAKRYTDVGKKAQKIADDLHEHLFASWIDHVPANFQHDTDHIYICWESETDGTTKYSTIYFSKHRPVVYNNEPIQIKDNDFRRRLNVWRGEVEVKDKWLCNIRDQVCEILKSVKTSKQLLEVWPEAKKIMPEWYADNDPKSAPAKNPAVESVNKLLYLG